MNDIEYLKKKVTILEYALSKVLNAMQSSGNIANEVGYDVEQEMTALAEQVASFDEEK